MEGETSMGAKQEEADLILKLYEMRRDEKLREAREWYDTEFNPQSAQDVLKILGGSFDDNVKFRMVLTYWEMVAALVNYGSLSAELVHSTNVEHLRYWAKIEPFMDELRQTTGRGFLPELEKMVKTAPDYEQRMEGWRKMGQNWIK